MRQRAEELGGHLDLDMTPSSNVADRAEAIVRARNAGLAAPRLVTPGA